MYKPCNSGRTQVQLKDRIQAFTNKPTTSRQNARQRRELIAPKRTDFQAFQGQTTITVEKQTLLRTYLYLQRQCAFLTDVATSRGITQTDFEEWQKHNGKELGELAFTILWDWLKPLLPQNESLEENGCLRPWNKPPYFKTPVLMGELAEKLLKDCEE